ncbi:senecionine N-oxygenase-like [Armigeres subalbatus]|uniref:senecionine N-oxygenase-like n=1 Tax=Armigeres subalbatus TaxID=124917 RepID=UPI002ED00106
MYRIAAYSTESFRDLLVIVMERTPKYCIIGAGAAGLICARHASKAAADITVYEQTTRIGGTWVYTDSVGQDQNGLPIHTSMYEGLRTNLPRQTMEFPDWPIVSDKSYVKQEEVLQWLEDYATKFNLLKLIRFEHQVIRVSPTYNKKRKWEVIVKDLKDDRYDTHLFDYVMVCNGHYSHPKIPKYPGKDIFKGLQLHSHDYRKADQFKGQDLLLVGAGYSASDIAIATVKVAKSVTVSYHNPKKVEFDIEGSITVKPDISKLTSTGVEFVDGSQKDFSVIIYCTGYNYTFPFLSVDCGIRLEENHVQPLYKHVININHPTMALIGIPFSCIPTQVVDLQAQLCMGYFTGEKQIPVKDEMLQDMADDVALRRRRGLPRKWMHKMQGDFHSKYYDDLARTAGIQPIRPVVMALFDESMRRRTKDVLRYREDNFEVINDEEFRFL